ncbi:MAG: DUF3301 domain-containing protein [Gammaproteobacteria bacterium]|jgi:hypothetical protein
MTSLALLLIIVLLVLFWQFSLHCHDIAIETARNTCKQRNIQFLDGTASLSAMRPYFSKVSGLALKRTYTFDYSEDGIGRQKGCIVMLNSRVETVLLDS